LWFDQKRRIDQALENAARDYAAKTVGNMPPPPAVNPDNAWRKVVSDSEFIVNCEIAGYIYVLLSMAYWILVWGFSKRRGEAESPKPDEKNRSTAL
ncbi:MAG: hypothetical protein ACPL5F_14595, partial [Moorellaceae bacterium]